MVETPSKRRVIIIDDDPAFAEMLSRLVVRLGHEVIVKSDPRVSDTYEIRDNDIVFLDILMPHVNGLQVLEQLGRQDVKSGIIIMSGQHSFVSAAEQVMKRLDLHFLGSLYKPFRLEDVEELLDTL